MRNTLLAVVAVMAAFLGACTDETVNTNNSNIDSMAVASPTMTTTPERGIAPKHDDPQFAMEASRGGVEEVELGRMAAQKSRNPDVKRFGERMVTDHSKANAELKQLAASKGITLPGELSAEQKAEVERLSKLSGAEFDREYMSMMVADHDKDVAAFQEESQQGSDSDIKAWASKTLPTLQEHQRMAHEINDKLKS